MFSCLCWIVVADVLPLEGVPILDEEDEDNDANENASAAQAGTVPSEQSRARELQAARAETARQNAEYAFLRKRMLQVDLCEIDACVDVGVGVQIRGRRCS